MNHPTELPTRRDLGADLPAVTEDQRHIGLGRSCVRHRCQFPCHLLGLAKGLGRRAVGA